MPAFSSRIPVRAYQVSSSSLPVPFSGEWLINILIDRIFLAGFRDNTATLKRFKHVFGDPLRRLRKGSVLSRGLDQAINSSFFEPNNIALQLDSAIDEGQNHLYFDFTAPGEPHRLVTFASFDIRQRKSFFGQCHL